MALVPTAPVPPVHELPLESDGQFSRPWVRYFQRVSNALVAMSSTAAGGVGELGIAGVTNGSDAEAGDVGEYREAATAGTTSLVTDVVTDLLTLDLPAGDWDVSGWAGFQVGGGGPAIMVGWGLDGIDANEAGGTAFNLGGWTGPQRYNTAGNVTVTLKAIASFDVGSGPVNAVGALRARRMR